MYARHIDQIIIDHVANRREVLILLGARQVGKTTLLHRLFPQANYLLVDNESTRQTLERYDITSYQEIIPSKTNLLIIDEIHLLSNPGRAAKIIFDQMPHIKLIITGSSSFNIKNKTAESLAGRKIDYFLYPLTITEYLAQKNVRTTLDFAILNHLDQNERSYSFDLAGILNNVLVYGLYPHLVNNPSDQIYLQNLVDSVIFKDILELSLIENRPAALNLLRALAFQIGSLVNITELSSKTGLAAHTVRRYLTIFEQSFIIFFLPPFTKRGRDEIGKMPKIYFYDVGLRNALISDFRSLSLRPDSGALWENFVVSEVLKANYYGTFGYKLNFWRTKQGSEVDLVLTKNEEITALEIKTTSGKVNQAFKNRYPQANFSIVTKKNFL